MREFAPPVFCAVCLKIIIVSSRHQRKTKALPSHVHCPWVNIFSIEILTSKLSYQGKLNNNKKQATGT